MSKSLFVQKKIHCAIKNKINTKEKEMFSKTRRKITAIFGCCLTLLCLVASLALPSYADEIKDAIGYRHGGWFIGIFTPNKSSEKVICIQAGNDFPQYLSSASAETEDPISAYALFRYGNTNDNATAAGLWWLLNDRQAIDSTVYPYGKKMLEIKKTKFSTEEQTNAKAKRDEILAEAKKFSGPYKAKIEFKPATTFNDTGKVVTEITSKAGYKVPGLQGKITLTNAVFDDGKTTKTFKTSENPSEYHYTATNGQMQAKVAYEIPAQTIQINKAANAGAEKEWQSVVLVNKSSSKTDATTNLEAKTLWTPKISTKVNRIAAKPGEEITDNAIATGGKPGQKFSGVFEFYAINQNPVGQQKPAGIKPFATVAYNAVFDKNGEAKISASTTIPKAIDAKYYTIVATINAVFDKNGHGIKGYRSSWGEAEESSFNPTLKIKSKAAKAELALGDETTDTWWIYDVISEFRNMKMTLAVTPKVYGPLPRVNGQCPIGKEAWDNAPIAMVGKTQILESGKNATVKNDSIEFVTESFKPKTDDACYSFGGEVVIKDGDKIISKTIHHAGDKDQGFYVPAAGGDEDLPATGANIAVNIAGIAGMLLLIGTSILVLPKTRKL